MKIVPKSEFDSLVFLHSGQIALEEKVPGVVHLSFGPMQVSLAEDAARDFLYQLTGFFAQKDLADYGDGMDAALVESRDALAALSCLHIPKP